MKKILLGCMLALGMQPVSAQILSGAEAVKVHPAAAEVRYSHRSTAPLYIGFRANAFVAASSGMEVLQSTLGAGTSDTWKLIRTDRDDLGMSHQRYQQYYQNVPVVTGEYILHEQQGRLLSANGHFFRNLNVNTAAALDEKSALAAALNDIGASKYLWQSSEEEQHARTGHDHGDVYPKGELVVLPAIGINKSKEAALCWKFDVYATEPHERWAIFVDAQTGQILFKENKICTITVTGTAVTKYSGTQSLKTDSISPGNYRLRDYSRGSGVETYDCNNGTSYAGAVDFTDTDNFWNTTTNQDDAAYDAHWGTQKTYDYYFLTHGRNSYNNAGAVLKSYIHYSSNYNNAFWNGSVMTYGDGDGATFSPLTEVDIIAHELTHGVTSFSSNLVYSYESGALNESFSDIFGVTVDFYARPLTANFLIGDQTYTPGTPGDALRYMNNPSIAGDPDTYLGPNWYTGAGDNGGVHINSGVQNFWYYLLCQGGTGTNDLGFVYNVNGIGMSKARMIAYRNNTFYLTSGSQYDDAAFYALKSANDLYGNCSPEAYSVKNAWDAVGVYGLLINTNAVAAISGGACAGSTIQLTASGGTTFVWSGPGGFNSSAANPTIPNASAANNGLYSCLITDANGCSGTASVSVAVSVAPSVSATGGSANCGGGSVQLNANASVPGQGGNNASNSTPLNLPDYPNPGVTSSLAISGSSNANALIAIKIDSLTHTYDADLRIELIAPNGSVITLASGVGGAGDNFIRTRFTTTGTAITNGTAPFTGNYTPQQAFSNLTGTANGTWVLRITDLGGQDIGVLWKWSLELPGNSIVSYQWTPATGLNNATIANPLASPGSTTNYVVTVTDNNGCTASSSTTVTVGTLSANTNQTNVSCFGSNNGSATVSVAGATGSPVYNWSNGASSSTVNGLSAGTYTYTVTDGSGCTATGNVVITSPAQLQGYLTAQNASCGANDGSAYLTFSGGVAPYSYLWNTGAVTSNISGLGAGTYTVTVTDANGCSFNTNTTVLSNGTGAPNTPASVTGNKTGVCPGVTKNYSCPAVSGATTYTWTPPAGATVVSGQGTTNVAVLFQAGFTSGTLKVLASNNCGNSAQKSVTLRSLANKPAAITGPATSNACGSVSTYTIPASTTGATSHVWSVTGGGTILSGQGTTSVQVQWPVAAVSGAGVCVTANNTCGSSAARCISGITTLPLKPGVSGVSSVCANQTNLNYNVTNAQAGVNYQWIVPGSATIVSGQGSPAINVNWGGATGYVKVTASNNCGAAVQKNFKVTVTCREGVEQMNDVTLFPNPGNGQTKITFNTDPGNYNVTVSDVLGKVVFTGQGSSDTYELNLMEEHAGMYFVSVRFDDDQQKVLRMIINK
jgi:Zn-dependent metalloprotease/subtilisin-like proprotein convertase family protein